MKFHFNQCIASTLVLISTLFATNLSAADLSFADNSSLSSLSKSLWKNVADKSQDTQQLADKSGSNSVSANFLELNEVGLKSLLFDSSLEKNLTDNSVAARLTNNVSNTITLPLPNGNIVSLKLSPSSVMSKSLEQQFPDIKTWKVTGVGKDISGTIDFTHQGFHAMLLMPDGDTIFIEPNKLSAVSRSVDKQLSENGQYLSFSKRVNKESFKSEFTCGVHSDSPLNFNPIAKKSFAERVNFSQKLQARPASDLVTYRLAVATTGEYTRFHGGTVSSALSAIATTINRVNEIYERDLNVRFELVDEQSEIIYLNPNTDPYTNSDVFKLIEENNQNLNNSSILGTAKFDIGHVFGAGNVGGLAQVGSVCNNNLKAQGATGIGNPIGEAFALDYVAHELGHQMGGTHTFNSACGGGSERTGVTAVEPGSGTTIMSYAGICQANNIQDSVDDYFHVVSIDQILGHSRDGDGSGCGALTSTGNENPTASAGNDFTVPARTPLVFTASGSDTDGDSLSYTWEQSNAGDVSDVNVDTGNNALFRSRPASSSGVRFIPQLSDLFNGVTSSGEFLPRFNRNMEMVVSVRDGKGGLQADLVNMTIFDTGESFNITSHTSTQSIGRGEEQTIRWNVAGTDTSPISCLNVDIGLATIDGNGLDIITTPNDGQQQITIPNNAPDMNNARFIISCNTSGFFNVSRGSLNVGDVTTTTNSGGGGGGTISFYILSLFSMLLIRRKYYS